MTRATGLHALFSLFALSSLAAAQCPSGCDALTPEWAFGASGGVDPKDGSFQQLLVDACPCYDNEPLINSIIYTGVDNQVTTDVATVIMETANSPTVVTHMFPTATNTLFQSGAEVIVQYAVFENGATASYGRAYYTYSPVPSITYVESTETIEATTTNTVSTTVTQTQTSTSTIPQQTSTTPCTTGTLTITAKASTSTVSSTITKPPVTKTTTRVTTVTVHASCVKGPGQKPKRELGKERRHLKRQGGINAGVGEQPWYPAAQGNPQSTTYTTGTTVETDTVTATTTDTQTATTTTTSTATPSPPTTTVCSSVQATTTVTPTVTTTQTTKIGGSTTTKTSTYTLTTTVWAHKPPPICSPSCSSHPHPQPKHTLKPTSSKT